VPEALTSTMLRLPREKALQSAACGALARIARHREKASPCDFLREAVGTVSAAMATFPHEVTLQEHSCDFLWRLAAEEPSLLATRPGLRALVERAAGLGVRDARHLLECVQWRTEAEAQVCRGAGRRRWGQWATGRRVAA